MVITQQDRWADVRRRATAAFAVAGLVSCLGAVDVGAAGAAELKKVTVLRSPAGTFEPLFIAKQKGLFEKNGLDVDIVIGGLPDQQVAQIISGQVQFAMGGAISLVNAVANKVPIKAISNLQDTVEPHTTALVVAPGSPVKSVKDLNGKSIGVAGLRGATHLAALIALDTAGIDPNNVKFINIPPDALIEAASKGNVDAIFPYGLFYPRALELGFRELEVTTVTSQRDFSQVLLIAGTDYMAKNADTVRAFNKAIAEAIDIANKDPELIRAIDRAETKLPPEFIATYKIAPFTTSFGREPTRFVVDQMVKFGFIGTKIAPEDMYSGFATIR